MLLRFVFICSILLLFSNSVLAQEEPSCEIMECVGVVGTRTLFRSYYFPEYYNFNAFVIPTDSIDDLDGDAEVCVSDQVHKEQMAICVGGLIAGGALAVQFLQHASCAALFSPLSATPPTAAANLASCAVLTVLSTAVLSGAILNCKLNVFPACANGLGN